MALLFSRTAAPGRGRVGRRDLPPPLALCLVYHLRRVSALIYARRKKAKITHEIGVIENLRETDPLGSHSIFSESK